MPVNQNPEVVNVLKAVADQTRWSIITQMAECEELACTTLENTLPISKSTISYHIKILYMAGLIDIRREGKFYFYRLRRSVLESVLARARTEIGAPAL